MFRTFFTVFFILLLLEVVKAQQNIRFRHLDTNDGLSQSWVRHIGQDKSGYIWIGTADGLNRYDGYSFEQIEVRTAQGEIEAKTVVFFCMLETRKGEMLFGTSNGLYEYNKRTNSLFKRNEIPAYDIYSLAQTDDAIWIGSYNLFEFRYRGQSLIEYFPQQFEEGAISSGTVYEVFVDSKNRVWAGTVNGLNLFNPSVGRFRSFYEGEEPSGLTNSIVNSIDEDDQGRLWIGTGDGLNVLEVVDNEINFKHSSVARGRILKVHLGKNLVWVGTENGGLYLADINEAISTDPDFTRFTFDLSDPTGLSNNSVYSIFEDNQSNIWIGTFSSGIDFYSPLENKFGHYQQLINSYKSLIDNKVNGFCEVKDEILVATEGGISIFNPGISSFKNLFNDPKDPNSLPSNAVWAIYQDGQENIWIGTWGGGLSRFDARNRRFIKNHQTSQGISLDKENVFAIIEDAKKSLWVGTMGGGLLKRKKDGVFFSRYTNNNSNLETDFVEDIFETSRGELIIANVRGAFVYSYETNDFQRLVDNASAYALLNHDNIFDIKEDQQGRLLIGAGSGLFVRHQDSDVFRLINMSDGLANNSIKSIAVDDQNNIWLGTNKGLSRVRLTDDLGVANIKNYLPSDGIQSNEFNRRASLRSSSGKLYFGGINGFNTLDISQLNTNKEPPKIVLTDFKVFNESVEIGPGKLLDSHINETAQIVLGADIRVFGFNYVGINYTATDKNQYAYILEGFDEGWNYVGTRREVSYTNIDPGEYVFKVKSGNSDGVWNEQPASLKVTILPPFYLTSWAYLVYTCLGFLALYLFRRYSIIDIERKRDLQIEALERQKEAEIGKTKMTFFTNISHEIRTPLTLIDGPVQQLLKQGDLSVRSRQQLELVNRNVRRLIHLINQLLDFRKIDTGHVKLNLGHHPLSSIIKSTGEVFKQQAEMQKIDFSMDIENETLMGWVDEEKLTTVLYNLISNAFKYVGDNGSVNVKLKEVPYSKVGSKLDGGEPGLKSLSSSDPVVQIEVSDNGIGIDEESLSSIFDRFYQVENRLAKTGSSGIGLNIVKEYVSLHHGDISVTSRVGEGSVFHIYLPNKKELFAKEDFKDGVGSLQLSIAEELAQTDIVAGKVDLEKVDLPQIEGHSNILLVEDEKELLKYLLIQLRDEYNLAYAENGNKALEKIEEFNPDLIVSDIMMPDMDGLEMTRILRSELESSHIPIIMLTAKVSDRNIIEGVEHGADVYLAKPFNKELLKAHISSLLDSRQKLRTLYQRQVRLDPKDVTITSLDESFLNELINVIEINMAEPDFDMETLSREMGMSYRSLVRKVKSLTGQTSNEFLKSMRLKKAAQLISKGQMPVAQVSALTGFNDPAYFSRCFQKEFGIPPSRYTGSQE